MDRVIRWCEIALQEQFVDVKGKLLKPSNKKSAYSRAPQQFGINTVEDLLQQQQQQQVDPARAGNKNNHPFTWSMAATTITTVAAFTVLAWRRTRNAAA
jgi:hypothetical protein